MNNKCDCYHTETKRRHIFNPITGEAIGYDAEVAVCYGTKEKDECKCNGDRILCDFYPKVRDKAKKELNDGKDKLNYKEVIRLLVKAIEQNTINTYSKHGSVAANEVFKILEEIENMLDETPDMEEVVRCENCNVPHNKLNGCPHLNGLVPPPDFYCAYGEHKKKDGVNYE